MRRLFIAGSKDGEAFMFSLSSEEWELGNGWSLENGGVVGVTGISSDRSDTDVEQLVGVLSVYIEERLGVIGRDGKF